MIASSSTARLTGARPVADVPVEALLARADELAKRWASALVATRALAQIGAVPLERIAREGPALCAQLVRALSSDVELQQLLAPAGSERGQPTPAGAAAPVAWLAPESASLAVRDVEALRGVLWEATLGELREPGARQVADLADRLAFVCAALLAAAIERDDRSAGAIDRPDVAVPPARGERVLYSTPQTSPGARRAVLIDERDETVRQPADSRDAAAAGRAAAPPRERASERERAGAPADRAPERREQSRPAPTAPRARPWDTPLAASPDTGVQHDTTPSHRAVPDGADAELRVTRGPRTPIDERS